MTRLKYSILVLLTLQSACASLGPGSGLRDMRFSDLEKTRQNVADMESAKTQFGDPNLKRPLNENSGSEAWVYFKNKSKNPRLMLTFDSKSSSLKTMTWYVYQDEDEADFQTLKGRLKNPTNLIEKKLPWPTPDAGPTEVEYVDSSLGLFIRLSKTQKTVESVSWLIKN